MYIVKSIIKVVACVALLTPSMLVVLAGVGNKVAFNLVVMYLCWAHGGCK